MNLKLHLPLMVLLVFMSTVLSSQKILHKANKQFELKHYHEAIDSYKKTLVNHPENLEARSNLAEAYRMTNQLSLAEDAYANIMPEEFVDPIHIRNYGITLMKMAKYNEAHYQFELYKIYNPQDAQHYQLSCEFAHHLYRQENAFEIELVGVNTPNSDFGVAFADDRLIFSSFRNDVELSDDAKRSGQKLTGNMLYIAELDADLRADNVEFLRSGIAEKKNIGPISFAPKAEICAFTRNKIQNGGAHVTGDDSYHSIYVADLLPNGTWKNERPFRYNEFGTSTGFPSLAFDGSALYFASNRVGGYGGYDIYVSYWKEGAWTYPENLGENINTPGNEITPFYNDEDLYFSSDYHHGMGGYDIFHSLVIGGAWTHPENMANGVNSPADDYYPTIKEGTEGIFFSSNRLGGRGMDDIYLAVPVENNSLTALELETMPEAVELADMESEPAFSNANPIAKAVANNDVMEVTVLNPDIGDTKPTKELVAPIIDENEELPMWGFAKPGETLQKITDPIIIAKIENKGSQPITSMSSPIEFSLSVNCLNVESENDLNKYILAMESNEVETLPTESTENTIAEVEEETQSATDAEVIEAITSQTNTQNVDIVNTEIITEDIPEAHRIPNYKAISANRAPLNLDLAGAKRVALGEILPASNVYFIQLAALSRSSGDVSKYKSLSRYGNLYKVFKSSSTKIKLGYFLDRSEANNVLKSVKQSGYRDAFVTKDDLGTLQLELILANDSQKESYTSYDSNPSSTYQPSTTVESASSTNTISSNEYTLNNTARNSYKIRLASYEDPIWFDIEKAKKLGKIEQWTKGSWTIFILGGYSTYREAEEAMVRCVNKGFADAEIVIDNNGILERLKKN